MAVAYLGCAVDAEIDKGSLGKDLEDLAVAGIEAVAIGCLVWKDVCFFRRDTIRGVCRGGSLMIATTIRDLATTAAVTRPFTIALRRCVSVYDSGP